MSALEALSNKVLYDMLSEAPDLALVLGLKAVGGKSLPEATLPDFSEAGVARRAAMMRDWARELRALPADTETAGEVITRKVLSYVLENGFFNRFYGLAGQDLADQIEPLTHLSGVHAAAVQIFTRDHEFADASAADRWLERLSRLPRALDDTADFLEARRRQGLVAPRGILDRALSDILGSMRDDPREHSLYLALQRGLSKAPTKRGGIILAEVERLIGHDVRAAYGRLIVELALCRSASDDAISVRRRPRGDGFYGWRFAGHTTTDLDPHRAHEIALAEIQRLEMALSVEFDALGVIGDLETSLREVVRQDAYPDGDKGRTLALSDAQENVERARVAVRELFNLWPADEVRVEAIARANEVSQHATYIPAPSTGEPATFLINLARAQDSSRSENAVTTWHETWPGHHLQLSLARSLPLPEFRRCMLFAAYLEGWAKYAEGLPETVGLAMSPYARIARLRTELYSTATLAMDTGIHVKNWSADQAAAFFEQNTGAAKGLTSMVVLRSAADPGHLCAYKVGLLKMRELRDRFIASRGALYRVQDFHDAVLGEGAAPLGVLDEIVSARLREAA